MKEKMQKKRQAILEAALLVFTQNGYEKTKIIDVAKIAGVGKGTVYEYFDSKEALFRCLLEEYCELYKTNVKEILGGLEDASAREQLLTVMHMEGALKKQVHLRSLNPVQLFVEFTNFPGLKQAIQSMLKFKFEVVCGILKEGMEKGEFRQCSIPLAAAALMGAGATVDTLSECPDGFDDCEEAAREMVDAEELMGFTDENLLDLLIRGLHF